MLLIQGRPDSRPNLWQTRVILDPSPERALCDQGTSPLLLLLGDPSGDPMHLMGIQGPL